MICSFNRICHQTYDWTLPEGPGPSQSWTKFGQPQLWRVLRPFQKVFWNLEPSNPGAYKPGFYEYAKDRIKKLCLRPSLEGPISHFLRAAAK